MTCTSFDPSPTMTATPLAGCDNAVAPVRLDNEPGPFSFRDTRPPLNKPVMAGRGADFVASELSARTTRRPFVTVPVS